MNRLVFLLAIVVGFTYFGGSGVPKILIDNKQVLLGITLGFLICSFNRVEGFGFLDKGCNCNGDVGDTVCGATIYTLPAALRGAKNSEGKPWDLYMDQCKANETCAPAGIFNIECAGSKHYNGKCTATPSCSQ